VSTEPIQEREEGKLELRDDFTDRRAEGAVIGTLSTSGHRRLGADVEGVLSIDHGALRIAPLIESGFGRIALAYGPFSSRPGLAFAVYMLNGHNTAQAEPLPDTFAQRIDLWSRGSRTESRKWRLIQWLRSGRIRRTLRQFRRWKRTEKGGRAVALLDENLAVGWFPTADTPDPTVEGSTFIMHALGPENGELWVGDPANRTRSLRGVQNLPLYFVAVMRIGGTVYYAASLDGAVGPAPYPSLRPLAIDSSPHQDQAYVCIHQSVLGQIGWRIDTRVEGVRIAGVPGYDTWWGGAHAAHSFSREVSLDGAKAEIGGAWRISAARARGGVTGAGDPASAVRIAVLDPGELSGLIYAVATPGKRWSNRIGLVWRYLDEGNHWRLEISGSSGDVVVVTDGNPQVMLSLAMHVTGVRERRLQVLDDGLRQMTYIDGEPMSGAWITDARLQDATGVGILFSEANADAGAIRSFEAHPRKIRLPEVFDMGGPWVRTGTRVVVADDFSGEPANLDGRLTPIGKVCWRRLIGQGDIEVTGQGFARVRGTPNEPCSGRTAYCVDWPHPDFADLEVTVTPPGSGVGERHQTTSGFILYQDPDNYVILNAYKADYYGGGSVSTFFRFRGFEDIYDAVWSNVGDRIAYGKSSRLRMCSDGERYLVFVDDEPVLYRAYRDVYPNVGRLQIRKAGIVANWEFGTDTGSKLEQFKLRF
jgi:hypothetical protein